MASFAGRFLLLVALCTATPARRGSVKGLDTFQQALALEPPIPPREKPRALRGKFLHITDIHPDPFYKIGANSNEQVCHRGHGNRATGYYGAPTTDCDTPFTLVDATFKWIETNIKDEIDFVVWTGDSARHDNDDAIPRDLQQVQELNRYITAKFVETFKKPSDAGMHHSRDTFEIPIVPNMGNNDIVPHNIFFPGPNRWTRDYLSIWKKFVPEEQRHSFVRGAYFWTEVIPNRLAVISLNTMYFFDNNAAVNGCDAKSEPGYQHMEWLRVQLQGMRERGMKAIMIGHVPPARTVSKANWNESCYQKYVIWLKQYRDVVVANIYGHMNVDHFMFHDTREVIYKFESADYDDNDDDDDDDDDDNGVVSVFNRTDHAHPSNSDYSALVGANYLTELRDKWTNLPTPPKGTTYGSAGDGTTVLPKSKKDKKRNKKKEKSKKDFVQEIGGPYGERFSMSIVSPSVVPNYFPTLRVIEYNISGLEKDRPASGRPRGRLVIEDELHDQKKKHKHKKKKKKKKGKHGKDPRIKPKFPVPLPPAKTAPPGPAYSPQTFSLLSWTQLYANLTSIHEAMIAGPKSAREDPYSYFDYKVEYSTNQEDAFKMTDLTLRHWLDVAEKISRVKYTKEEHLSSETTTPLDHQNSNEAGNGTTVGSTRHSSGKLKANALWHEFVKRAFVYSKADSDLEGDFD